MPTLLEELINPVSRKIDKSKQLFIELQPAGIKPGWLLFIYTKASGNGLGCYSDASRIKLKQKELVRYKTTLLSEEELVKDIILGLKNLRSQGYKSLCFIHEEKAVDLFNQYAKLRKKLSHLF